MFFWDFHFACHLQAFHAVKFVHQDNLPAFFRRIFNAFQRGWPPCEFVTGFAVWNGAAKALWQIADNIYIFAPQAAKTNTAIRDANTTLCCPRSGLAKIDKTILNAISCPPDAVAKVARGTKTQRMTIFFDKRTIFTLFDRMCKIKCFFEKHLTRRAQKLHMTHVFQSRPSCHLREIYNSMVAWRIGNGKMSTTQ